MRKVILFLAVMLIASICEADRGVTSNYSATVTGVHTGTTYQNITLSPQSRNLKIYNYDTGDYIWVALESNTATTVDTTKHVLIGPTEELFLYDYRTNGITILRDTTYSTGDTASPIVVISTY